MAGLTSSNWLKELENTEKIILSFQEKIQGSEGASDASRRQMSSIDKRLSALKDGLKTMEKNEQKFKISRKELDRRHDLLSKQRSKFDQLEKEYRQIRSQGYRSSSRQRSSLMGSGSGSGSDGGRYQDSARTEQLSDRDLLAQQQETMAHQDQQFDVLGQSVLKQKKVARAIGDELDEHTQLLDEVDVEMDRAHTGVETETRRLNRLMKKSGIGCGLICIVLLLGVIIVAMLMVVGVIKV
eukprot:gb/GECH01014763.1/.p1 GENE.gb/GECH01014763.1/~~gb/GECH01014763.1/.p1  ORF type:complete len:240 (+),score=71.99 gb/GECH01014763.1/:1-720(+)